MVIKFRVDVDTKLSPKQVLDAFTDFSKNRTKIWPGLSKKFYKVHSLGRKTAEVTEGSDKPISVWAREKYDWSKEGVIKWSVLKSDFSLPGHSMEVRIEPKDKGSHVTLFYDRGVYGFKGIMAGFMMKAIGKKIITKYYQDAFKNLAG